MSQYLLRPDDYAIFVKNEDGTFSNDESGMAMPYRYSESTLLSCGFIPVDKLDMDAINQKQNYYRDFINWFSRSDGHGGIKGGTHDDFKRQQSQKY